MENLKENIAINSKEESKKEEREQNDSKKYYMNAYHPFWSLFNDCFTDDEDSSSIMRTDITDVGDGYKVEVEVPGVEKNNVKISLDNGYLVISAKVVSNENSNHKSLHRERFFGSYRRSYYLGDKVNKGDISASMDKGLLTINIKKPVEKTEEEKFIPIA